MKLTRKSIVRELKNPLSFWQTILLTAIPSILYLFRAFPYFIKPQLYAEDGTVWISQGRIYGAQVLLPKVYAGFFHYPERLWGFVVASVSLQWAPAIFAVTAWLLFIVMVYYLLSSRTKILINNYERIFTALSLGLIANFKEFFFNFSNSVFLMGIIGILILVAKLPKNRMIDIAEKLFFALSCMALPFSWIYLPITLWDRFRYKTKNSYFVIVSGLTAALQALGYFTSHPDRSPITFVSLFSKWTLLEIYNQIIIPAVRFARVDIDLTTYGHGHYPVLLVGITVTTLVLATLLVIRKNNRSVLLVLLFLAGMTLSSLKSPTLHVKTATDALKVMSTVGDASRYFIYGILGVTLVYVKTSYQILTAKYHYVVMGLFLLFGLASSLHYGSFKVEKHWNDYTKQYSQGVHDYYAGKKINTIPINPSPWTMGLYHVKNTTPWW